MTGEKDQRSRQRSTHRGLSEKNKKLKYRICLSIDPLRLCKQLLAMNPATAIARTVWHTNTRRLLASVTTSVASANKATTLFCIPTAVRSLKRKDRPPEQQPGRAAHLPEA